MVVREKLIVVVKQWWGGSECSEGGGRWVVGRGEEPSCIVLGRRMERWLVEEGRKEGRKRRRNLR